MVVLSTKKKLLESAQKNFLKGQYDRSIAEYRQVIAIDPADVRHRQRLAEILAKINQKDEAIKEYTSLAKHYIDSVHYLKAIAVYKQIQKIDPENPEISLTLASLNEKQGLIGNATAEYAAAVRTYESRGENLKALKTLEAMLALDPGNFAVRLRIAEKYFSTGSEDKAADEFVAIAHDLKERDDQNGYQHVIERVSNLFQEKTAAVLTRIKQEQPAAAELPAEQSSAAASLVKEPVKSPALPSPESTFGDHAPVPPSNQIPVKESVPPVDDNLPLEDVEHLDEIDELEAIEEIEELEDFEEFVEPQELPGLEFVADTEPTDDWEEEIDLDAVSFAQEPELPEETVSAASEALEQTELPEELEAVELELDIIDEEEPLEVMTEPLDEFPAEPAADTGDFFDIGDELSRFAEELDFDLITTKSAGDQSLFDLDSPSGFKKNELENEDAESHYSLGLAYKEMGLFDEAITEFLVAAHSPERKIDCMILMAVCLREVGELQKAVEILAETLKEPDLNEDEVLGIKYELAICHEALAETELAKQLYSDIIAVRPDFSDTAVRLSQL